MNKFTDSVCLYSTFYKLNLAPINNTNIIQYSKNLVSFDYVSDSSISVKEMIIIEFDINPYTFNSNQTVCMAY